MKKTLLTLLLVMITGISWAQSGWEQPEAGSYASYCEVAFTLDFGKGDYNGETAYEIAAFIDDELRGFTKEFIKNDNGYNLYTLIVYGNEADIEKPISFKFYDPTTGITYNDIYVSKGGNERTINFDTEASNKGYKLNIKLKESGWEQPEAGSYASYCEVAFTLDFGKGDYNGETAYEIAAFIDDELRGFTKEFIKNDNGYNLYTLIVYGNEADIEKPISFKFYDPTTGITYNDIYVSKGGNERTINFDTEASNKGYKLSAVIITSIDIEDATLYKGGEGFTPEAIINEGYVSPDKVTINYTADDNEYIKIEDNKIIPTGIGGPATVTAACDDAGISTTFDVTVISALESVTVSNDSIEFTRNANGEVEITGLPTPTFNWIADAPEAAKTNESYTLTSSDPAVIEIREGKAISLKDGFADITYTSVYDDTKSATFTVEAIQGISSIAIDNATIYLGTEGYTPVAKIFKGETEVTDATFSLSVAEGVTAVKIENNKIIPAGIGTATVTATCNEATAVTATFTVTVKSALESVTLGKTTLTYQRKTNEEEEIQLPAPTFNWIADAPEAVKTNNAYTITSSDPTVIEIREGKAVSLKQGSANITYTSKYDATKSATLVVNVEQIFVKEIIQFDFEEGIPQNAVLKDLDGLTPYKKLDYPTKTAWRVVTDPEDELNQVIQSCSYYDTGGSANDWIVFPNVELPADADACKLFWRSRSAYPTYKDGYAIYATTEKITSSTNFENVGWQRVFNVPRADNPETWKSWECDMSKFAGQTISLAFNNSTSDGWYLYIDDITICSRETLPKGSVKITSSKYAKENAGIVTARFKGGMFDNVYKFDARLVINDEIVTDRQQFKKTIAPNDTYQFTMSAKVNGSVGEIKNYRIEIINSDNDDCYASDEGQFIFIKDLKETKKVVAETFVNNDNGHSIQAIEGYKLMASEPWFIGLQLHGDKNGYEPMTPKNEPAYKQLITETYNIEDGRTVIIDRLHTGEAYNDISKLSNSRNKELVLVKADIKGVTYSDKIVVETSTIFALNSENSDCSYSFILTEDNVVNTQRNMYYGGGYGSFNGYETMDLFVNVSFNDVVRKTYTGATYGKDILAGDTVKNAIKLDIPENILEPANLKMTMIITDNETGEIINAARCALAYNGGASPDITGIEENEAEGTISIENGCITYNGYSTVKVQVYTTLGEFVGSATGEGNVNITLPEQRGIYIVEICDGNNTFIKKVIK